MSANAEEPPSRQAKHVLETGYEPYLEDLLVGITGVMSARRRGRYSYKDTSTDPRHIISCLALLALLA